MRSKFISMASVLPYTKEELKLLLNLLENDLVMPFGHYCSISGALYEQISYGGFDMDRPDSLDYKHLNFLQYLLIYHRKVFLFLMCVPNRNIPLYMNGELGPFVQWRMRINK